MTTCGQARVLGNHPSKDSVTKNDSGTGGKEESQPQVTQEEPGIQYKLYKEQRSWYHRRVLTGGKQGWSGPGAREWGRCREEQGHIQLQPQAQRSVGLEEEDITTL